MVVCVCVGGGGPICEKGWVGQGINHLTDTGLWAEIGHTYIDI